MTDAHPVESLFIAMSNVEPYPPGVLAVPARIRGTAFFPGGCGLWNPRRVERLPPLPIGGVMVLGHDFHSRAAFTRSFEAEGEVIEGPHGAYRMGRTWRNLLPLLEDAGIRPEECFFTNAYMGLRESDATMGRFPGSRDPQFVERCRRFFVTQLRTQRPAVILSLGAWVPRFLAPLAPQLAGWRDKWSLDAIDAAGPVVRSTRFEGYDGRCVVVALTHPSMRGSNVRRRRYDKRVGAEAELAMLADAREGAVGQRLAAR